MLKIEPMVSHKKGKDYISELQVSFHLLQLYLCPSNHTVKMTKFAHSACIPHTGHIDAHLLLIRNSWQRLEMDSYGKRKVLLSFTESYLFKKNSTGLARLGRVGRLISKSLSCFKDQIGKTTSCPPWSGTENPWHLKKCVKDCVFSLSLELLQ